jgi:hypothetical protein
MIDRLRTICTVMSLTLLKSMDYVLLVKILANFGALTKHLIVHTLTDDVGPVVVHAAWHSV